MRIFGLLLALAGLLTMGGAIFFQLNALRVVVGPVADFGPSAGAVLGQAAAIGTISATTQPFILLGGFLFVGGVTLFGCGAIYSSIWEQYARRERERRKTS